MPGRASAASSTACRRPALAPSAKNGKRALSVARTRSASPKVPLSLPFPARSLLIRSQERQSAPHDAPHQLPHLVQPVPPPASPPPHPPYMSIGLPPAYYPPLPLSKTVDPPPLYPPYLFAQLQPAHNAQDGVSASYPPPGPYYPATLLAQFSPSVYAQYPVPRPDAQLLHPNIQYTLYGHHACARQTEDPGRSDSPH